MKKTFRKLTIAAIAAVAAMSVSPVYAEESMQADEIIQKMYEAEKGLTSTSADMALDLDAGLKMKQEGVAVEMGVKIAGDMDVAAQVGDVIKGKTLLDLDLNIAGEQQKLSAEVYFEEADGKIHTYAMTADDSSQPEWSYQAVESEEFRKQLEEALKSTDSAAMFADAGIQFEVREDRPDAYVIGTEMKQENIAALLKEAQKVADEAGSEEAQALDISSVEGFLYGIVIDYEIEVQKDTFLPSKMTIDLGKSDFAVISSLIAAGSGVEAEDVGLTVNSAKITAENISYDPIDIEIPAEGLAAKDAAPAEAIAAEDAVPEEAVEAAEDAVPAE